MWGLIYKYPKLPSIVMIIKKKIKKLIIDKFIELDFL